MAHKYDDEAATEATAHAADAVALAGIELALESLSSWLPNNNVADHAITFKPEAWAGVLDALPHDLTASGRISRGAVFAIAAEVRARTRPTADLFTATYLWGQGVSGYGRTRYDKISEQAGQRLEENLRAATQLLLSGGPISAYAWLYGGECPKDRRVACEPGSGRIADLGPAFFTKVLYFADTRSDTSALILDKVLATKVHQHSRLPYLIHEDGRAYSWTPYRYDVYLNWMRQTATTLAVAADLLELALFSS